jgi:hypothetical protein
LKTDYEGCAICGSTWGDVWAPVDGESMFFCCDICARQFQGLVARIKAAAGWPRVDEIHIQGDRRGRTCTARRGESSGTYFVAFTPDGRVREFHELAPTH